MDGVNHPSRPAAPNDPVTAVVVTIRQALAAAADPVRAAGQQAYMKSALPFRGVGVPQVRRVARQHGQAAGLDLAQIERATRRLWDEAAFREERYAALGLTGLPCALGRLELVPLYEHVVVTGAWWDFTDEVAHRIAALHDAQPAEAAAVVRRWAGADSLWLRRLAIISQLGRRERTDVALLAHAIGLNADDAEFFIRKAIGWALRDYARSDPAWVRAYVACGRLSPLSGREALKHLT
jgi:3-methyladenine DNA glycosylase AlkD